MDIIEVSLGDLSKKIYKQFNLPSKIKMYIFMYILMYIHNVLKI